MCRQCDPEDGASQAAENENALPAEIGALWEGTPQEVLGAVLLHALVPVLAQAAAVRSAAAMHALHRLLGL